MRVKDMDRATDASRKRLANAEADFQKALAGQQLRWAREQEDYDKEVARRQSELAVLEERRKNALEPVSLLEERAKKLLADAELTLQKANEREQEVEELKELLEGRLDAVGAREQDVLLRERQATATEENIKSQQRITSDNLAQLSKDIYAFKVEKVKFEQEMNQRNTTLILRERSLEAWSDRLTRTESKLVDWEKRLRDERGILERAFARIKKPYPHTSRNEKA